MLHWHNFLLVPNTMDCVLPKWSDNLLLINQSFMDSTHSSSELKVASIPTMSLPEASKTKLSTYNNSLHLTAADMSFIYKRNNRDPSIEPCGMPQVIPLARLSILVNCTLPVKYDLNHHLEFTNTYTLKFLQQNGMFHSIKSFLQIQQYDG